MTEMSEAEFWLDFDEHCENIEANDPDTTEANTWRSFNRRNYDLQALRLGRALRGNTMVTKLHIDLVPADNVTLAGIAGFADFIESSTTGLAAITIRSTPTMVAIADRLLAAITVNGKIKKLTFEIGGFTLDSFTRCFDSLRPSLRTLELDLHRSSPQDANTEDEDAELQANAIRSLPNLESLGLSGYNTQFTTRFMNKLNTAADTPPLKLKKIEICYRFEESEPLAQEICQLIASAPLLENFELLDSDHVSGMILDTIASGIEEHRSIHTLFLRVRTTEQAARMALMLQNNRNISSLRIILDQCSLLEVCLFLETLVSTGHPLEQLEVLGGFLEEGFSEGHQRLGELLPQLTTLKKLEILGGDRQYPEDGDEEFTLPAPIPKEFVDGVKGNKSLTSMKISWICRDPAAKDSKRMIDFVTARNGSDPPLTEVPIAQMLFLVANGVLEAEATYEYPETGLSVVYDTVHQRANWFH